MNETFALSTLGTGSGSPIIIETQDRLGSLSVFISSILLSVGGFCAMFITSIHKSKCSKINCLGTECTREHIDV
jgi:hypothetical protein